MFGVFAEELTHLYFSVNDPRHMQNALTTAQSLYSLPFMDLVDQARAIHRQYHPPLDIQKCTLLSIKTGGCPEDCAYCPQSAHYDTGLQKESLLPLETVRAAVKKAKSHGAQRFCMGAAWRNIHDGPDFDRVLEMIRIVKSEQLEACVTLGMLTDSQAERLKEAGLDAYNHNLDTSRDYYEQIIQTRTYQDRLKTLQSVRTAGIQVCSGIILGMGESIQDRCAALAELAQLDPQPESVPINLLIPVEGTPLAKQKSSPVPPVDLLRAVAVARILMPYSRIRLSAGRMSLSSEAQTFAFYVGANSIHMGEKLLTRPNATPEEDEQLLGILAGVSSPSCVSSCSPA